VRERRPTILDVAHFLQAHPEVAYEEYECANYILNSLSEMSEAERGLAGMPTGFRATVRGAEPGPTVGLVAVYDAVGVVRDNGALEAVHSCGHGPVSGAVVGAALALAAMREQLSGTVIVLGCPADELVSPKAISLGSGKSRAIENGALGGSTSRSTRTPNLIPGFGTRLAGCSSSNFTLPATMTLPGGRCPSTSTGSTV
jgi:metal-dependent amidase/aminoacylase/carboxypeptidase family protein